MLDQCDTGIAVAIEMSFISPNFSPFTSFWTAGIRVDPPTMMIFLMSPLESLASAMALSMLGYRCCSDFDRILECELESLLTGCTDRVFDAYVNIESLTPHVRVLTQRYPRAKFIVINDVAGTADRERGRSRR